MENKKKENKSILDHIKDVDLLGGESFFDVKEPKKKEKEEEDVEEKIKDKEEDEYARTGI